MSRRIILALVALALVSPSPRALADRLGGNYRGPLDDIVVVRDDASTTSAPDSAGGSTGGDTSGGGGDAPPAGGGGSTDGGTTSGGDSGGGDSGGGDTGGGDTGGGDTGGGDSGGDSGGSSSPESGGGSSPESGGGGDSGGSGGGSAPPGGSSGAPAGGSTTAPGGGSAPSSSGGIGKKSASADDKDKIWPFYFEGAKEEYIRTVYARRPAARMSPKKSSTFQLSNAPVPHRERSPLGETDRMTARDLVVGRLEDPDAAVRDAAVIALGKGGFKDAVRDLVEASRNDSDPQVREDAFLALGLSGQVEIALPTLLRALEGPVGNRNDRRVAYAALGLGLLGDGAGAAPKLREIFRKTSVASNAMDEAACAATALGMLQDAEAIDLFAAALKSSRTPDAVKVYTLHALGKFDVADEKVRKEVINQISRSLKDKQVTVKRAAVLALGSFPEAAPILAKAGLGESDEYTRNFAVASLGRIAAGLDPSSGEYRAIAKQLVELADNERKSRTLCQYSNVALASMAYGDQEKHLLGVVDEGLNKVNTNTASAVVLSLGLLGSDSAAVSEKLFKTLESKSFGTNVQAYAGLALAMADAPGAVPALRKFLDTDDRPSADVARSLALGLGLVGGKQEVDILVEILKGTRHESMSDTARHFLMGTSAISIGLIGDAGSVEKLRPLMNSKEWRTRAFATAALGYLMESEETRRVSPRITEIFRHHNYTAPLPVVRQVQSIL